MIAGASAMRCCMDRRFALVSPAAPHRRRGQRAGLDRIEHIVVIYAENRSFDNLYGLFPGANGIANATPAQYTQVDHDGKPLPTSAAGHGKARMPIRRFRRPAEPAVPASTLPPINLPLSTADARPDAQVLPATRSRSTAAATIASSRHRMRARWRWATTTARTLPMWKWAQEYTLADNFFMGAFGGSYLNHFWLICACTPRDRNAPPNLRAQSRRARMAEATPDSPASALDGSPRVRADGDVTPDGYSVNTTQPPYQPSRVPPAKGGDPRFADPAKDPLPPQTQKTIGDTLSAKGVSWAWYAGAWNAALKDGMQPPERKRNDHRQPRPTARRIS